ncbi:MULTISPECIES: hypothetical protein [unclassified Pseudomonas]|uniref:hypothetical protein n=1 Tax=unclassified Pseudomonas TaxID=196821 RepID=UPI003158C97C
MGHTSSGLKQSDCSRFHFELEAALCFLRGQRRESPPEVDWPLYLFKDEHVEQEGNQTPVGGNARSRALENRNVQSVVGWSGQRSRVSSLDRGRADPVLREKHSLKVTLLVVLTCIQALIGAVFGFFLFYDATPVLALIMLLIAGGIPLLFAWGFYKNVAAAYTVYVLLTISQVSPMFKGYEEDPLSTVIAVGITLAIVFYAAWIKSLLFPDLGFIGAKKIKGQFVFSN